jgi:hypothetical protein
MRKRLQRYEITVGIAEHPAVVAWMEFSGGETANALFAMKERFRDAHKSAVYLLKGCGPGKAGVVAKHTWLQSSATMPEAAPAAYALLDRSPDQLAPRLFGTVVGPDGIWMFFEYVGGIPFDRQDPEHRRGAARLAARIHSLEPTDAELAILPRRDPAHYQQRLLEAAARLRSFQIATDTLCPPIVELIWTRLETVLDSWGFVEQCFRDYPAGIVHGDLTAKNLFVRPSEATVQVVAVDWDTVGFGYRYVDLECVDVHEYRSASGLSAEAEANDALAAALRVGLTLRLIDSVAWTATKLQGPSIDRPVRHLESYDRAFAEHLPLGLRAARR